MELKMGMRMYYGGDMANDDGFGTITLITHDRWGTNLKIAMDDGREMNLSPCQFSPVYEGHGGTRFVTLTAYNDYKRNRLLQMNYDQLKVASGQYDAI